MNDIYNLKFRLKITRRGKNKSMSEKYFKILDFLIFKELLEI